MATIMIVSGSKHNIFFLFFTLFYVKEQKIGRTRWKKNALRSTENREYLSLKGKLKNKREWVRNGPYFR